MKLYITTKQQRLLITFYKFLQQNNIYDAYVNNFMQDTICCTDYNKILAIFLVRQIKDNGGRLFFDAFVWNRTTEGAAFWAKIHEKWLRYIDKYMPNL